jgi:hypothetical protein
LPVAFCFTKETKMLTTIRKNKFYIIISIAALFVLVGYLFYKSKKDDFLQHGLKNVVKEKTNYIYNVNYDLISVDEVGGDLFIKNIYIKGDTARQRQLVNNKDTNAAAVILDIYIPMLRVVDFKTARALLSKQLECKRVIISNPQVHLYLFPGQQKPSDARKKQEELYKQILGNFKLIKADSVSVLNSQFIVSDFFTKDIKFHTFNTSVNLSDVAIDSTFNQDTTRTLFCKELSVLADKVVLGSQKNTAEILQATFDTRSKIVSFSSISYDAYKNDGFFKTTLSGISLHSIEWLGPVENSDLVIDKAIISKGDIETLAKSQKESKSKQKKEGKILTGWINSFKLNSLQVKSVNYASRTREAGQKPLQVRNNAFVIKNINIDRTAAFNDRLLSKAEEIELKNDLISVKTADDLYEYKLSGLTLNTRLKGLSIKSIRIIPQLDEAAFAKNARFQTDRYNIAINNLRCNNIGVEKLIRGEVNIETITTSGNSIKVFRDLSYPIDSVSKLGQQMTYPHQIIHKLPVALKISKVIFSDTDIEYKEKNAISKSSGRVRFSNTSLVINNISNLKAKAGEKMTVNFRTNFLNKVPVTGGFVFSLDQWQKGVFTVRATISSPLRALLLNELTEPMALLKVEEGTINAVQFDMKADTNTSTGTFVMPYEDLKISMLKKDGDQYNKKTLLSLVANLAVKNSNKAGNNMRKANILITRNKYRSFFNFIWLTMFKGIKDIGVVKI